MRDVVIIGIGQTRVEEHWGKSLRHLAHDAIMAAMRDADIETADALYVGNMLSGELSGQEHLGALIADFVGLRGIEAMKVEAACASGAAALRVGMMAVASGMHDVVMVCGVEKMTDALSDEVTSGLATAADQEYEVSQGISFVGLNALLMRRYMHEYDVKHEQFAGFAVNAHKNGANNPNAMFQSPIKAETYLRAGMIADPINLMDSSPVCDGAACVDPGAGGPLPVEGEGAHPGVGRGDRQPGHPRPPRPADAGRRRPFQPEGVRAGADHAGRHRPLRGRTTRSPSWPRCRWRPPASPREAVASAWPLTTRSASTAACPSARWAGSRRAGIRSAPRACTRSSKW